MVSKAYIDIYVLLITVIICVNGEDSIGNRCDYSQQNRILTCIDLKLENSNFSSLIKDDTNLLVIRSSHYLTLPSNYHTNKKFLPITTYLIVDNGEIEISSFAFTEMENLRYLKINNNQKWATLRSNTFDGLEELIVLNINNNSMYKIENNAFKGLSNLNYLELMHNKISGVPSAIFSSLSTLKSLHLSHNQISMLETDSFVGLDKLQVIDMTHNNLKVIETSTFNGVSKLSDLYLSHNQISVIYGELSLPNLQFLYLHHNKIKVISELLLNAVPKLRVVDLSYNEIEFVPDKTFYNLCSLDHLNLEHNNVSISNLKFSCANKPVVV